MEPNNPPAPPQRFITSAAQFHQLQQEARAAALKSANAAKCADFPKTDDEKLVLIDQLLAAMTNTAGLVDNVGENPDENGDVKAIRNMPRERQEEMAWIWLYKMRDIQLGIRNPDVYTPEFPNFMSRFRAFVSFVRSTKAGVTDLFAASYADRYIGNPIAELDTKVSNNHTNKLRIYNTEIKGARDNGRTVTENDNIAEIRDAAGALVKSLIKPRKRPLDDFLDGELPPAVKRPKRAPRSRTATGSSAASVATATTTGVGGQPAPAQGAAANALPAIQEEEEGSEPPQANRSNSQVNAGHPSLDQLNGHQPNVHQQTVEQQNIYEPNVNQSTIDQSHIQQANIQQTNIYQQSGEHTQAGQSNIQQANIYQHNTQHAQAGQMNIQQAHVHQPIVQQRNIQQRNIQHGDVDQLNIYQHNAEQAQAGQLNIQQSNILDLQQEDVDQFNIYQHNAEQAQAGQLNIQQRNIQHEDVDQLNSGIYQHNAEHAQAGQYPASQYPASQYPTGLYPARQYHASHEYQPFNAPNQYQAPNQYGAEVNWAQSEQAPAVPANFPLDAVDPALGDHSNRNGGSQGGSERAAANRSGRLAQNKAGANWWVEDDSSDDVE